MLRGGWFHSSPGVLGPPLVRLGCTAFLAKAAPTSDAPGKGQLQVTSSHRWGTSCSPATLSPPTLTLSALKSNSPGFWLGTFSGCKWKASGTGCSCHGPKAVTWRHPPLLIRYIMYKYFLRFCRWFLTLLIVSFEAQDVKILNKLNCFLWLLKLLVSFLRRHCQIQDQED